MQSLVKTHTARILTVLIAAALCLATLSLLQRHAYAASCGTPDACERARQACLDSGGAWNNTNGTCASGVGTTNDNFGGFDPASQAAAQSSDCSAETLESSNCGIIRYLLLFIDAMSALVGVIVVASIVAAGIQYSSAADDPAKIQQAKNRIQNSVIAFLVYIFMFSFLQWIVPGGIFN